MSLVAQQHVGSSQTRDRTRVSFTDRRILYHWATREALLFILYAVSQQKGWRMHLGSWCELEGWEVSICFHFISWWTKPATIGKCWNVNYEYIAKVCNISVTDYKKAGISSLSRAQEIEISALVDCLKKITWRQCKSWHKKLSYCLSNKETPRDLSGWIFHVSPIVWETRNVFCMHPQSKVGIWELCESISDHLEYCPFWITAFKLFV